MFLGDEEYKKWLESLHPEDEVAIKRKYYGKTIKYEIVKIKRIDVNKIIVHGEHPFIDGECYVGEGFRNWLIPVTQEIRDLLTAEYLHGFDFKMLDSTKLQQIKDIVESKPVKYEIFSDSGRHVAFVEEGNFVGLQMGLYKIRRV